MKIDIEMTYEEFLWVCKMAIKCEKSGFKIEKIKRNPENNEVSLSLEAIILGEDKDENRPD